MAKRRSWSQHRADYERLRKAHAQPKQKVVGIETARKRRTPIEWRAEDIPTPAFTGVRVLDNFPLATLREFIDWSPFFHTWGLKGIYPRIFDHPEYGAQARQIFTEANALLDRIIAKKLITARGVYGFFPANAVGDDVELYTDSTRTKVQQRFHFLRQQANREGSEPCRSLADFIAPKETGLRDHIGAFAVTSGIGLKELCDRFRAKNDDYNAIMAEAIADRLAEAFAECLHKRVREEWGYGCKEGLSNADLIEEKYRGIRPAAGYPACPDHTEKGPLWRLLDVQTEHRHADHGVLRDVARLERKWALLRPPGIPLFQPGQDRPRSGRRLRRAQRDERGRGRALARAKFELRSRRIA